VEVVDAAGVDHPQERLQSRLNESVADDTDGSGQKTDGESAESAHPIARRTDRNSSGKGRVGDIGNREPSLSQYDAGNTRGNRGPANFLVMERLKKYAYQDLHGSFYFWRTYGGQEVDLVEESEGRIAGFEFTWSER
jgi:hypothetical protein